MLSLFSISCSKQPINGKLDGMWQLTEIEYPNGTNVFPSKVYYSIQLHILKLSNIHDGSLHGSNTDYYVGRFEHTNDSLNFYDIRHYKEEEVIANPVELAPYGLNGISDHFAIEKLTGSNMVLKSTDITLYFRKF